MSKKILIEIPDELALKYYQKQINLQKPGEKKTAFAIIIVNELCHLNDVEYKIKSIKKKERKNVKSTKK